MLVFPVLLLETSSRYNPDIRVVREWGGLKLLVNGSPQSGPYIRMLWEKAFKTFRLKDISGVKTVLVLGIGGGTVIELLAKRYPRATITAVDIDPTIIDIAKRYFHIDQIPRLRMFRQAAQAFVREMTRSKRRYDLVIVDLFIGREIPAFVTTSTFYQNLKQVLAPGGRLVLNYLRELAYSQKSDALLLTLRHEFAKVGDFPIANNRFFSCNA